MPENVSVIGCRVWDEEDYPAALRELWEQSKRDTAARGEPFPKIYPGSTIEECASCDVRVAVGPLQQTAIALLAEAGRPTVIFCLLCTAFAAMRTAGQVYSLGNPDNG